MKKYQHLKKLKYQYLSIKLLSQLLDFHKHKVQVVNFLSIFKVTNVEFFIEI